ncbi:EAL domain-containing protein [Oceanobacillus halophilus]|uniref:EAL domain-containing protein n=1 Tax=Oceanobacillus halophilus TaxID=930130 RepID=UPI0013147F1C|nr:EAL domain-containing protein [Oceanobacillus halophilus]
MINSKQNFFLNHGNLYHVIQPIVDLHANKAMGYEFLVRSPQFQNPESLFRYASEVNQLFQLDMHSISQIFKTYHKEQDGMLGKYLFINILPSTFMHPSFQKELQKIVESLNIQPNNIVFEITEVERGTNLATLRSSVADLKKQGFMIALDDIGQGESSIVTILEIEPDIGKLDRYFAMGLSTSIKKQKVIKQILKTFGDETKFILEGLEKEEDLLAAKRLGIPYGQGFHLGKPKPVGTYLGVVETS